MSADQAAFYHKPIVLLLLFYLAHLSVRLALLCAIISNTLPIVGNLITCKTISLSKNAHSLELIGYLTEYGFCFIAVALETSHSELLEVKSKHEQAAAAKWVILDYIISVSLCNYVVLIFIVGIE